MQAAAEDKRIEIASDFIINSKGVFEALNVTGEKTVELTFPIENLEDIALKTPEDKKFFETAYKMTVEKRVKGIRVLLILKEADFINNEKLQYLCSFYNENKAYECRYILKDDFVTACEHNLIPSNNLDFGIYGPQMLFKVEQYEPYKGVYTKNIEEVRRYRDLFNQVWDFESMTHDIKTTQKDITTPVELFDRFENGSTKEKTITPPSPIIMNGPTIETEDASSETDTSEKTDANNNESISVGENLNSAKGEAT